MEDKVFLAVVIEFMIGRNNVSISEGSYCLGTLLEELLNKDSREDIKFCECT